MDIILEIAKKTAAETQLYNIGLKRSFYCDRKKNLINRDNPLKNFFWPCWGSMLPQSKKIHYNRAAFNYYFPEIRLNPVKTHNYFVQERIKAGWVLSDERLDFIIENDQMKWIGHDPYLMNLNLCPAWFQEWCIARNAIAEKITKEYL